MRRPAGPAIVLHDPPRPPPLRWSAPLSWLVVAAAGAALLWIAFGHHPIGDYATESDFYGGYVDGARLWQQLRPDPVRYAVAGPGYDAALGLLGFAVRDLFAAARLLSVLSALGVLVLWRSIVLRRGGADLALWTVAFLAANPLFGRYGSAATTDMFSIFLQAAALHAFLAGGDRWAFARGGALAALATLTRYNAVYLVPFGILHAFVFAPRVRERPAGGGGANTKAWRMPKGTR